MDIVVQWLFSMNILWTFYGHPWTSLDILLTSVDILWTFMVICGHSGLVAFYHGHQWTSMNILWTSMDIYGHLWTSVDILWTSMDVCGHSGLVAFFLWTFNSVRRTHNASYKKTNYTTKYVYPEHIVQIASLG